MLKDYDVDAKLDECMNLMQERGHSITRPRVLYDLRGHTAGYAVGGHTIRLNIDLLNDERYREDMINDTVPHEFAHIVVAQLYKTGYYSWRPKSHGREWETIMRQLGIINPGRCHDYETVSARRPYQTRRWQYECDCRTWQISTTIHNKMSRGQRRYCPDCGGNLFYTGG